VLFEYDQRYENLLFGYSGSLVMDKNNHALGLFWAGSRTFGLFCKIQHVFDQYNVKLVGGS
jgi:hypothetical protein